MHENTLDRAEKIVARSCGNAGYCTLALIDTDGYPTAATISLSKAEGLRWLTFCTGLGSNWVRRIGQCDRASVCFNAPQYNITLVGTVEVLTDLPTKQEMWYEGMGYYFKGPEDPGFCVLRFRTQRYSLMVDEKEGIARGTL